jgi:hypothetical protein
MSGFSLVCDMSVSCFLAGGEAVFLMALAAGFRTVEDFVRKATTGLDERMIRSIESTLKKAKISIVHLAGQWRKCTGIGPAANHPDSTFSGPADRRMTVADYFAMMAKDRSASAAKYRSVLPAGKLKYPMLPLINIGGSSRPVWLPPELVRIPGGQCRPQKLTPEMTADMIRGAAGRPDERLKYLVGADSV